MGIFDWKHWIVLLIVVVLVFGTKKLKNFGGDLGESIKGFRKAMSDEETKPVEPTPPPVAPAQPMPSHETTPVTPPPTTIDGQARPVQPSPRND
ncbi:twin-arginine translocase TatA/TatE family subunit [Pseudomonas entomophila]|uniref:twin-arginine translocase TatA/TatE family subunit n=1 Tax=Pseudomonas entomophila TaxID=312306 RepID=UPI0015E326F8|nr:twin-arginine translocase TatA/TatE family subunit [Pseudomonas entomophila]MBA1193762.1 twin-arginine translocase TatA/TatE family subunit [Pseudomonas entomophila]